MRDYRESSFSSVWNEHHDTLVSQIAVPILVGSELVGVLSFESDSTVVFRPEHVRMLWSAANKFGIAQRLTHQSVRVREMLEGLGQLSLANPDGCEPLHVLARLSAQLLDADACDVWALVPGVPRFRRMGEWNTGVQVSGNPRESGWTGFVVRSRYIMWLGEIESTRRFSRRTWTLDDLEQPDSQSDTPTQLNTRVLEAGSRSELCVPLCIGDRCIGAVWFKYRVPHMPAPNAERRKLAKNLGALLSVAADSCMRNSSRARDVAAYQSVEIREHWNELFPAPPQVPGIDIGVVCHTADEDVGGDFHAFDVEPAGTGQRVTFVIGDATGHGMIAAMRMLPLLSAYKLASVHSSSPTFRIERMRRVTRSCQSDGTALCVSLHVQTNDRDREKRVFVASACVVGHDPAIVFRKESRSPIDKLSLPKLPNEFLGVTLQLSAELASPLVEYLLELKAGDLLVAYTDGIDEAHSEVSGPFKRIGIERVVSESWDEPARVIAQRILDAAKSHADGVLDDDCTVIVCRIG